jgi:hypothetical protein
MPRRKPRPARLTLKSSDLQLATGLLVHSHLRGLLLLQLRGRREDTAGPLHNSAGDGPDVDLSRLRDDGVGTELGGCLGDEEVELLEGIDELAETAPDGVALVLDLFGEFFLMVVFQGRVGDDDEGGGDTEGVEDRAGAWGKTVSWECGRLKGE